jgi:undecaprenyl diphosphate synthase
MNKKLNVPQHVGIIMDGNRRWAKENGLNPSDGHLHGAETLKKIVLSAQKLGIKFLTVFAFSTENWKRSPKEIESLMKLAIKFFLEEESWARDNKVKVKILGEKEKFSLALQKLMAQMEEKTKSNKGIFLNLALSYGGRDEIVRAAQAILKQKIGPKQLNQETISSNLWTTDLPDPDLIIRTGGEKRLSGFLLWQSAYAEILFVSKYWPEFNEDDLRMALDEYSQRQRRFGR